MISAVPLSFFSLFLYCCPAFCIPLCLPVCLGRYVLCLSFRHFLCYFVAFFLPNVAIFLLPAFVLFTPSLLSDVVHLCIIGFFLGQITSVCFITSSSHYIPILSFELLL